MYTYGVDGKEELIADLNSQPHGISFMQALREIATGHPDLVDEDRYLTRLKVCNDCPKRIRSVNVCGVCKCIIPLKARFTRSACPEHRW